MSKNDGGSAFPFDPYIDHPTYGVVHRAQLGHEIGEGMSLRDYFAGQALAGIWANQITLQALSDMDTTMPAPVAAFAYAIADGMIAERGKTNET